MDGRKNTTIHIETKYNQEYMNSVDNSYNDIILFRVYMKFMVENVFLFYRSKR